MTPQDSRYRLPHSERAPMAGAKLIGPADPQEKIEVTIFLRRGSKPGAYPDVARLGALPPKGRRHLSREEFARDHGAAAENKKKGRGCEENLEFREKEKNGARVGVFLEETFKVFTRVFK